VTDVSQAPTKRQLANQVAKVTGLSQDQALAAADAFLDAMSTDVVEHGRLELRNFGVFEVGTQGKRKLKQPGTGKTIKVPAHKVVRFRAGKAFKDKLGS